MDGPAQAKLRALPQIQRLLETTQGQVLVARFSHTATVSALRLVLEQAREGLLSGAPAPGGAALLEAANTLLHTSAAPHLRRVINATGIILHTNLGRAPLAEAAIEAMRQEAAGYCTLEYDIATGARGSRTANIEPWLQRITGAAAGLAVNNCAAAMLLALTALAQGGDVIVSRGELVEIGGGFRIPDIIQQGGARLVEVGTTNRTRLADYQRAITPETRVLLSVHQSNFRISGFTERALLADLAGLARARNLLLVHDLGSGSLQDLTALDGPAEATVQTSVAAGADVVAFSGDKLMGGPQAGILVGQAAAIATLRQHPLMRALRLDKLTLAALEATLRLHEEGPIDAIPTLRMLGQSRATLQARADALAALLPEPIGARLEPSTGFAGGGTLPESAIHSVCLTFGPPYHRSAETKLAALRAQPIPVIGRIANNAVLIDMLAVTDTDVPALAQALVAVFADA